MKTGTPKQPKFAGRGAQVVDLLLHGVADEHQRLHPLLAVFLARVAENLADLGVAAAAIDARHQRGEFLGTGDPARGAALAKPTEIDQLNIEPAGLGCLAEHIGLQGAGAIPGRLPAHGGVEREDQPPTLAAGRGGAEPAHALNEFGDLGPRGGRRRRLLGAVFAHGNSLHRFKLDR